MSNGVSIFLDSMVGVFDDEFYNCFLLAKRPLELFVVVLAFKCCEVAARSNKQVCSPAL